MRWLSKRIVLAKANRRSVSVPSARDGSGTPQCAVIGCPDHRADFLGGVITDETEVEGGRAGAGELIPRLGAQSTDVVADVSEQIERVGVYAAARLTACAIPPAFVLSQLVHDGFSEDRARRIVRAEEQRVEGRSLI